MQLSVARDEAALSALWADWDLLWQRTEAAEPFLSPGWLRPWWGVFGTGQPHVVTLWRDGRLLALLPLYRLNDKLLPMGVGISDYFDCLLAPEADAGAASHLLAAALDNATADRCDLPELPPHSPLLGAPTPRLWTTDTWNGSPCPVLPLQPEPAIPKGMRRDLRQARHRADRSGNWRIERADRHSFPALFPELVRLHSLRWQQRSEPGVFSDPCVPRFHLAAGPGLIDAGVLRLEALYLRGQAASVIVALLGRRDIYFYLSGFDPVSRFESPGTVLLGHMIGQAAAEGRCEAHFLRGDERYKYGWGAVDRFNLGRSFRRA